MPGETESLIRNRSRSRTWRHRLKHWCDVTLWIKVLSFVLVGLVTLAMVLYLVVYLRGKYENHHPQDIFPYEFVSREDGNFDKAWKEGEHLVEERENLEKYLYENGLIPKPGSPSFTFQSFSRKRVQYEKLQNCAIITEHVRRTLGKCVSKNALPDYCEPQRPSTCVDNQRYRTYNGSCNNLRHPFWGMTQTPFTRMLRPQYADGVSSPRSSIDGSSLPNARVLSNKLYSHKYSPDSNYTLMSVIFGLFVDHDMVSVAVQTGRNFSGISCCDEKVIESPSLQHPECMPVEVPRNDPFYSALGITCLDFVRSSPVAGKCSGQREQLNLASSFLDGSAIYGSSEEENEKLRMFSKGQLLTSTINKAKLLPQDEETSTQCGTYKEYLKCFRAGDKRVNMQESLTVMHTVWMREHNRIARVLSEMHSDWDDEAIFQEARKITIAELQHITYNEFLPLVLGPSTMKDYQLEINRNRMYGGYDAHLEPGVYNVFPTAALRFGHSLIQGKLDLHTGVNNTNYRLPLRETFFNMDIIYKKGLDPLLEGLAVQRSKNSDACITSELRNHLFQKSSGKFGMDLSAIGIQRGRDHGLPGYTKWRETCGFPPINSWDDLKPIMAEHHIHHMKQVYRHVEDIDLIPAALAEYHVNESLIGPTYNCLLGRQFHRTRESDRFWFENRRHDGCFTKDQLQELYKSNIARIVCDNSDRIENIQKFPFQIVTKDNPVRNCSDLPQVNLFLWKSTRDEEKVVLHRLKK